MTIRYQALRRAALGLPFLLWAAMPLGAQPQQRTVSVSGNAEVRVVPDRVTFSFGIQTENKDVEQASRENDKRLGDLMAAIERLGVAKQDVQTNELAISPRYAYKDGQRGEFEGFQVSRGITVVLKDFSKVRQLLAGALKAGVTDVGQGQFSTSDMRKYRDEARKMAARAAREKAALLAGELGVKVGRVVTISEESDYHYGNMVQNTSSRMGGGDAAESGGDLAAGEIAVSARVAVVFELE